MALRLHKMLSYLMQSLVCRDCTLYRIIAKSTVLTLLMVCEVDHRGLAGYLHDTVYSLALSLPGNLILAVTDLHHICTVQLSAAFL
jgi:hypothetical protein